MSMLTWDVFLPAQNRIASELRCILWAINSMLDIRLLDVEIWSDCGAAVQAINHPKYWPKYCSLVDRVRNACLRFRSHQVKLSLVKANTATQKIVKSVTHEGRVRSYLAQGGRTWLNTTIEDDRR
ncbi:putative protein phosphatase 2C-like protein 45 [Cardamine amara subsp. amara]|uniref:RNase H type-1 domain-containing protein n=1 Tax=Cardamine amara subsp. amara TaxID=228776 RepID=A0ABD1C608_CARAN